MSGYQSLVQWGSLKSSCVRTRGFKSRTRQELNCIFLTCLITKVWSNGGASRALVFALVGSNPTSDKDKCPYWTSPYGSMDRASDF